MTSDASGLRMRAGAAPARQTGRLRGAGTQPIRLGPCLIATLCTLTILVLFLTVRRSSQYLLPTVNACLIVLALSLAAFRAQLDLTRSFFWLNCILFAMFVLHPLALISTGTIDQLYIFKFDRRPQYIGANLLATVSIIASNVPFLVIHQRGAGEAAPRTARPLDSRTTRNLGLLFVGVAAAGAAYLFVTGFYSASSTGQAGLGRTAYTYFLPTLVVPGIILLLMSNARKRSVACVVIASAATLIDTALLIGNGQRTGLLLVLGGPLVYLSRLRHWRLPRVTVLVLIPIVLFAFGALRDANAKGSSLSAAVNDSVNNPGTTLLSTFTGQDTGMLDGVSLEMQIVPSQLPFDPFVSPLSIVSAPIPRILWPNKPVSADVILNSYLFGRSSGQASIAYSVVGEGFLAGGPAGVAGLSFAYGALFAYWDRRSRRAGSGAELWFGLGALMPALVPTIVRGITAYNVAYMGFIFLPLLLAAALSGRAAPAATARAERRPRRFVNLQSLDPTTATLAALPVASDYGPHGARG